MIWDGYPAETRAALHVAAVEWTRMPGEVGEGDSEEAEPGDVLNDGDSFAVSDSVSLDAATLILATTHVQTGSPTVNIAPGAFIAKYADELAPWTHVLAAQFGIVGYLSIPCCSWAFNARFQRGKEPVSSTVDVNDNGDQDEEPHGAPGAEAVECADARSSATTSKPTCGEEEDSHKSAYSQCRIRLVRLLANGGREIECDSLRMPSTRA